MADEELRICVDYCFYRIKKAGQDLRTATNLLKAEDYRAANNRAYYSIFHSLRAVLALDSFDSKKHSGIISEFRKRYIKTGIFPAGISKMIESAFEIRSASDYDDMFIASKSQTEKQVENAKIIFEKVEEYIGPRIDSYKKLLEEQGNKKDSQVLNLLLVSLFSADTLLTVHDCARSERELTKLRWAAEESELSDDMKTHWIEIIEKGLKICRRDKAEMEKNA